MSTVLEVEMLVLSYLFIVRVIVLTILYEYLDVLDEFSSELRLDLEQMTAHFTGQSL